jgi:hypothetical protein
METLIIALVISVWVLLVFGVWVAWRVMEAQERQSPVPTPVRLSADAPAPVTPIQAPKVTTTAPRMLKLRLVTEGGALLGYQSIPAITRKPTMRFRGKSGMGIYMADRQEADGVWVYRRVGVDR